MRLTKNERNEYFSPGDLKIRNKVISIPSKRDYRECLKRNRNQNTWSLHYTEPQPLT